MVNISNMMDLIQGVVYKVLEGLKEREEEGEISSARKAPDASKLVPTSLLLPLGSYGCGHFRGWNCQKFPSMARAINNKEILLLPGQLEPAAPLSPLLLSNLEIEHFSLPLIFPRCQQEATGRESEKCNLQTSGTQGI